MSNVERTGWRDYAYSAWHRSLSDSLSFLDIDWLEWCKSCYRLLAVYELAVDNGRNDNKQCWVTRKVAAGLGVKGYLVLYAKQGQTVTGFRVRRLAPREDEGFTAYSPEQWADQLYALRWCHPLSKPKPSEPSPEHVHGWAREDEMTLRCVMDWKGRGPGCGQTYRSPKVAS